MEKRLQGKKYIALARCSSASQVDTSIDEQLRLIEHFGDEHGLICVGRVTTGVTGSVPGVRSDIEELVRRKREQDDFEIIVVQDATRLTRSGPSHGMHLLYRLRSLGVDVVSVKDDLPEGDLGDVMRTLQYYSAKQQADGIAFASTRGASASLYMGKTAHCKAPPYGIDRLYCSEEGTPKHVIRNLPDGTQLKLHPETGEILDQFGRNKKTGVPAHYIKQKTEQIRLVPGDPERVRTVRAIFERHLSGGWGYFRIARDLNDRGVVSPRGGRWSIATVRSILFNPVYLGTGVANLSTSAIYYLRGPAGPVPATTDVKDLADGRPARRVRQRKDWFERQEAELTDLLDESLRTAASVKQRARFDALAAGLPRARNRDRHRDSSYLLKGIITAKQGGHALTGRTTGKKNRRKRYYTVSRAHSHPTEDKTLRNLVPAEPIEHAVVSVLQEVLINCQRIHEVVRQIAEYELRAQRSPESDLADLQREKALLEQKLTFVLDELDSEGRDAVRAKALQIQARLKQVNAEISRRATDRKQIGNPDVIADAICGKLSSLAQQVPSLPRAAVRKLLQVLVDKLVVDLETRDFEVIFALPEWATVDADQLCLVGTPACKTANEAQPTYVLATYQVEWHRKERVYRVGSPRSYGTAA